jgi:arylsulfatase A-like enzyme
MTQRRNRLVLVAVLSSLFLLYFSFSHRSYNVILITIDTLRSDYLQCYNSRAPSTPNIDAIARKGVLFTKAYSLIPITVPAHGAIFASRLPHELSLFNNGDVFDRETPMLAEVLAKAGYHTGGFISLTVLKRSFGLSRGFQSYEDDFGTLHWYRVAAEVNRVALHWIDQERNNRFFAWIHYSDPHEPYISVNALADTEVWINGHPGPKFCLAKKVRNSFQFTADSGENELRFRAVNEDQNGGPVDHFISRLSATPAKNIEIKYGEGWGERVHPNGLTERVFQGDAFIKLTNRSLNPVPVRLAFNGDVEQTLEIIRKNYGAEVQYVDDQIGQLWNRLEELGIRDRTIVILTSDHGEGLGTHKRVGHGFPLYQELTHVPLIIYYPGLGLSGKRSDKLVNHLDIMPTILSLLHLDKTSGMSGQSLKRDIEWSPFEWLFSEKANRSYTFVSTYAPQGRWNSFAVVHEDLKLIQTRKQAGWKWEAYNLSHDPTERRNLVVDDPVQFQSENISFLRRILEEHSQEAERAHARRSNQDISEDDKNMLRDLGYITP